MRTYLTFDKRKRLKELIEKLWKNTFKFTKKTDELLDHFFTLDETEIKSDIRKLHDLLRLDIGLFTVFTHIRITYRSIGATEEFEKEFGEAFAIIRDLENKFRKQYDELHNIVIMTSDSRNTTYNNS